MEEKPVEELSFKQAMDELDSIVSKLESDTLELEESLKLYARGVSLMSYLQTTLTEAEQKIEVLMGELEAAPDDMTQDSTLLKA
jgi:exodeoxyribonuclease VII small subunit